MNETTRHIRKVALAVFKDGAMLMVREAKQPEVFYTLGGKIEDGEDDMECLAREVREEVGCEIIPESIIYMREFSALAFGKENTVVHIRLYAGSLRGQPAPSHEVAEVQYFDSTIPSAKLTAITQDIFAWLKAEGHMR